MTSSTQIGGNLVLIDKTPEKDLVEGITLFVCLLASLKNMVIRKAIFSVEKHIEYTFILK